MSVKGNEFLLSSFNKTVRKLHDVFLNDTKVLLSTGVIQNCFVPEKTFFVLIKTLYYSFNEKSVITLYTVAKCRFDE